MPMRRVMQQVVSFAPGIYRVGRGPYDVSNAPTDRRKLFPRTSESETDG